MMLERNSNFGGQVRRATSPTRRAFSLTEILVVMGIIIIIAVLALPAFNVMTGSKSIESATNYISAALAQARSEALNRQEAVGLAVYFDQEKQRTALATVGYPTRWAANIGYQRGDLVYRDEGSGKVYWLCFKTHTSESGAPVDGAPTKLSTPPERAFANAASGNWALFDPKGTLTALSGETLPRLDESEYLTILPEAGVTYLPPGIGAQVLNGARALNPSGARVATDRYLKVGVVLFEADGRLTPNQVWGTLFSPQDLPNPPGPSTETSTGTGNRFRSTRLGLAVRFNTNGVSTAAVYSNVSFNLDPPKALVSNNYEQLTSGLGVVLYDRQGYENQNAPLWDMQTTNKYSGGPTTATQAAEDAAENWLDGNGTLLLINRYTGTLLKAE